MNSQETVFWNLMKCRRGQSSMTLDNPDDRFRRNWAISFLSFILFMFNNFLLIPFIRFSTEVVSQRAEVLFILCYFFRFYIIGYTSFRFTLNAFFCWPMNSLKTRYWVAKGMQQRERFVCVQCAQSSWRRKSIWSFTWTYFTKEILPSNSSWVWDLSFLLMHKRMFPRK